MFTVLIRFASFISLSAIWIAVLWFVLRIDFSRQNMLSVLSLHALPPLLLWGGWALWKSRAQSVQRKAELRAEEQQLAEQASQREAAKAAYDAQMRERCFALDCRWAQVASSELAAATLSNIGDELVALASQRAQAPGSWTQTVASVLENLYSACPSARYLPVYAPDASLELARVSELSSETSTLRATQQFLPDDGMVAGILACFERDPGLIGAVFVAADGAVEQAPAVLNPSQEASKQADAIVVMLITHPRLRAMVLESERPSQHDVMTPFWERGVPGIAEASNGLPIHVQRDLGQMPLWGQLHKPAIVQGKKSAAAWRAAMEIALVNAHLKPAPFVWEKSQDAFAAPETKQEEAEINCAWLAHNAGRFEQAGEHLSALGRALSEFEVNLDLIKTGSNVTAEVQLGKVDSWVSVALAMARSKQFNAPTLWANFSHTPQIGFVMPATPTRA